MNSILWVYQLESKSTAMNSCALEHCIMPCKRKKHPSHVQPKTKKHIDPEKSFWKPTASFGLWHAIYHHSMFYTFKRKHVLSWNMLSNKDLLCFQTFKNCSYALFLSPPMARPSSKCQAMANQIGSHPWAAECKPRRQPLRAFRYPRCGKKMQYWILNMRPLVHWNSLWTFVRSDHKASTCV